MIDLQKPWPLGLSRKTWPWFLLSMVGIVAALATIDIAASRNAIDWPEHWRAPFFFITDYGLSDWVLIPSLVLMLLFYLAHFPLQGVWRAASAELATLSAFIFVGVGVPGLIAAILKRLIGRSRPSEFDSAGAFSFQNIVNDWTFQSFPSGHSTTAVALAFTLGFVWPALFPILFAVGIIVAISRVPVGMHYPTDVFAGIIVGMLGAYLIRNFFASRGWLFENRADGRMAAKPFTALRQIVQRPRE